ncbi:MAG: DsbA family protein, partial [Acidimicrobiales bacterium]
MKIGLGTVLVAALAVGAAGCSGTNSVGSGVNLHSNNSGGALSLGSTTTTTNASATTAASGPTPTTAPP